MARRSASVRQTSGGPSSVGTPGVPTLPQSVCPRPRDMVPLRYMRGARLRGKTQCVDQRLVVEAAFIRLAVDEKAWRARRAAAHGAHEVLLHLGKEAVRSHIIGKALHGEPEALPQSRQQRWAEQVLVLVDRVMHGPELVLRARRLGCLCRQLRD